MSKTAEDATWVAGARWFLAGQGLSEIGSQVVQFALIWYLTIDSKSGSIVTLATIAAMVPLVIMMPLGGVLADRYSRRKLICVADGTVALATLALMAFFVLGYGNYAVIMVALCVRGFGQGIQVPTVGALLTQLVPEEQLGRYNGYNSSINAAMTLLSPLLAGALIAILPIYWVLAVDIVTAVIGIGILLFRVSAPPPKDAGQARDRHPLQELVSGARYLWGNGFLRPMLGYFSLINLLAVPVALLTPLQVVRTFGADMWRLPSMQTAFSVGMIAGGLLVGVWGVRTRRVTTMMIALSALGSLTVLLGMPNNFVFYCFWMVLSGFFLPFLNIPAMTMVQLIVDDSHMGRVYSLLLMVSHAVFPIGMVLVGPLADRISIELMLIVSGIAMIAVALLLAGDKKLRSREPVV